RVLARLRGTPPPAADVRWDQDEAACFSMVAEFFRALGVYSSSFVDGLAPDPAAGAVLAQLAASHALAILSNWPFAATIDRYVEAMGWSPLIRAVVVSQRVGV